MRKYYLLFLLFASLQANSQELLSKISEHYYRSIPFHKEFSRFVEHMMKDPTLINDTVSKKTDSTLFYMRGSYQSHNPFFFKAIRTDVILAEREEFAYDSLAFPRTIFQYQLLGYAPAGEEGLKDVQEEFERVCRRYKKGFTGSNYRELKSGGQKRGEIRDYMFRYIPFPSLTVSWIKSEDGQDNIFALTIRFFVHHNQAMLVVPLDGF